MSPLWLKHIYIVLSALTWRPMPAAAYSRLCSRVLAWAGVFASQKCYVIGVLFSLDGDIDYFNIVAGVLQGDTLAPYLFIICLDYVLRMSTDKMKNNGFNPIGFKFWYMPFEGKYYIKIIWIFLLVVPCICQAWDLLNDVLMSQSSFVCTQLNSLKYCYLTPKVLFAHS